MASSPIIQFKRGGAGIGGTVPALNPGEPAFSTNNFDFFIGFDTSVSGNKFFGSHRYWTRENGTTSAGLNLVDKNGSNYIQLRAPAITSGIGTYTLPDTNTITDGYFLKVASNGQLSWATAGGTNGTFTNPTLQGITTITSNGGDAFLDVNVLADFSAGANFNTGVTTIASANIDGGSIDGTVIGSGTSAAATFTNLTAGVTTVSSLQINGSGTYTDIDTDLSTVSGGHDTLASALAIKTYVDNQVTAQDLDFQGDAGGPLSVDLDSQIFTIKGTANEIETVGSGTTLTIGLPNQVSITTSLVVGSVGSATTINAAGINVGVNSVTAQDLYGHLDARYLDIVNSGLSTLTALADQDDFVVFDLDGTVNKLISAEYIRKYVYDNVNGDVTVDGLTGQATISSNAVGLGTQTTGDYVLDVTAGDGLAKTSSSGEGQTVDLSVTVGTGITITSDAVTLKGAASLTDSYLPAWDDVNGQLVDSGARFTVGGGTTITGDLHVTGSANIGSITGTAGTAQSVHTTATSSDGTYYILFADDATSQNGETVRVSAAASLNPNGTGTFSVGSIQTDEIRSSIGSSSITINNSGTVEFNNDVTIKGDLFVTGNTTQVNTSEITVEDRTIELGVVNGALPTDTTWDLGILMNYGESGVGKTSAIIWESASSRFVLASNLTEAVGVSTDLPQITPSTYAPLEISQLWINNSCTGGSKQVIGCSGSQLVLQNITVDGGTF